MRLGVAPQVTLERLFRHWSSVQSYWDDTADRFHVRLTLDREQLEGARGDRLTADPTDAIRPYRRRIRKGPRRGLRGAY